MQRQRDELYPFFEKHAIPTASNFVDLIDSMLNQETDGVFKPSGDPLSIKGIGAEEGLLNFYRVDEQGGNQLTWQFKQKPTSATNAGLSIHDAAADPSNAPSRLFIEGGTGYVGLGTMTPKSALAVSGGVAVGTTYATTNAAGGNNLIVEGNVGIGTTAPGAKLSFVNRNATEEAVGLTWHDGGPTHYGIHRTAGPWSQPDFQQLRLGWLTGIILDGGTGFNKSYVDIQGNGLRVTAGNVGIGTTSPGEMLHLASTGSAKIMIEADTDDADETHHPQLLFSQDGGNMTAYLGFSDGTNHLRLATTWDDADSDIDFMTRNTVRMTIEGDGNVGIGTTTPKNKLDVEGGAVIGASYSGTYTAPTDGLLVKGNVGIGTTAPANKLDVEGAMVIGAAYSGTETAPSNGLLVEGNVGIGTTGPLYPLHVDGKILSGARDGAYPSWIDFDNTVGFFTSAGNDNAFFGMKNRSGAAGGSNDFDTAIYWGDDTSDSLIFETQDQGEVMRITGGGNVGIGTDAPGAKLDVHGRILRWGQDLSYAGVASDGDLIPFPVEGTTAAEWNIFVSPNSLSLEAELGAAGTIWSGKMLWQVLCGASATSNGWEITARYAYSGKFKSSISSNSYKQEEVFTVNYLIVPR